MEKRKLLVLATFALFCVSLGGLWLCRARVTPRDIALVAKELPTLGRELAPVELLVFEDMLCRRCSDFNLEVLPVLQQAYIDTGRVRYIMGPLALTDHSQVIGNAALSIFYRAPGQFFTFIHRFFLRYNERKPSESDLLQLASEVEDLDMAGFKEDLRIGRYDNVLEKNFNLASGIMNKQLRLPVVLIDGNLINGSSLDAIAFHIDEVLKERIKR